jgi:hypothetical protein
VGAVLRDFKLMLTPDDVREMPGPDNWDPKRVGRWLCIQHKSCGKFEMFRYGTEEIPHDPPRAGFGGAKIPELNLEMLVKIADSHVCS